MPCGGIRTSWVNLLLTGEQKLPIFPLDLQDPSPLTRCPDCGWEITSDFSWCPQCGTRFKPYQCSYCRGWVPVGEVACPHCGASEK